MNLLALDIGNTTSKLGLFEDSRLLVHGQVPTDRFSRHSRRWLLSFLRHTGRSIDDLTAIALTSVVPAATDALLAGGWLPTKPFIITGKTPTRLVNRYRPPARLGADRLVTALAAAHFHQPPVICASFGSAIVVDAVSAECEFLGGAILPGLRLQAQALGTLDLLPEVKLSSPPTSPIADTTTAAIEAGIVLGAAEAVAGLARRFRRQIGKQAKLIVTGGDALALLPYLPKGTLHRPNLALEGIRLAWAEAVGGKR